MSDIRVDNIKNEAGTGSPSFPYGANVTGIVSATSFSGNISGNSITSGTIAAARVATLNQNTTGSAASATVATNAQGLTGSPNISVGTITATGNVSVGGTLTYEDVTNVDSVGIVTARSGVKLTGGNYTSHIVAMGANDVDCSTSNYFTKTITGATTFTFSNVPTSTAYIMTMEVTLNGSNAITWPAAVKWPADTAPTLTDGKTQLFTFVTDDGGTRWRGSSLVDYTN